MSKSPPKTPEDPTQLARAITLLGARTQNTLSKKHNSELAALVGKAPSLEEAKAWKSTLKQLRKKLSES